MHADSGTSDALVTTKGAFARTNESFGTTNGALVTTNDAFAAKSEVFWNHNGAQTAPRPSSCSSRRLRHRRRTRGGCSRHGGVSGARCGSTLRCNDGSCSPTCGCQRRRSSRPHLHSLVAPFTTDCSIKLSGSGATTTTSSRFHFAPIDAVGAQPLLPREVRDGVVQRLLLDLVEAATLRRCDLLPRGTNIRALELKSLLP
jgi:hypothetical protein